MGSDSLHYFCGHILELILGEIKHLEAPILAATWTLADNDKIYKFKLKGIGALGYGVQKLSGVGHVYHLNAIADFAGGYSEARGGITVGKGIGGLYIRNDKGVVIELRTHAEGVALSVGVSGITIEKE